VIQNIKVALQLSYSKHKN